MTEITIIAGFLGAGKTTLIKKLLTGPLKGTKIALIENDYGDINVDGAFLEETGVKMEEIMSGCICCTLAGDFSRALLELKKTYRPDRIIIEPSGVGRLSDVVRAVESVTNDPSSNMELFSTLTVVDATIFDMIYDTFGEFYRDQIQTAGTVYLSHTDDEDCTPDMIEAAVKGIRGLNPEAGIITTPIDELGAAAFLETVDGKTGTVRQFIKMTFRGMTPAAPVSRITSGTFQTWSTETTRAYSRDDLEAILRTLRDDPSCGTVLRAKGLLRRADSQPDNSSQEWLHFDLTPGHCEVRSGHPGTTGLVCVIGSGLDNEKIAGLFRSDNC